MTSMTRSRWVAPVTVAIAFIVELRAREPASRTRSAGAPSAIRPLSGRPCAVAIAVSRPSLDALTRVD
jgi:hypothetical protein